LKKRFDLYSISIHVALVGLCAVTLFLSQENKRLKGLLAPPPNGPEVGQSLQPLRWQPLEGEEATLEFASAERESLLLIFTTDCPACSENQEAWRTVHEQLGDRVDVVGISLSELETTRGYRDARALPFPVGVPVQPEEFANSLAITGVPMTIRVGPDGRVRGSWSGTLSEQQVSELSRIKTG